jgi:uncharacterized protein (UPF0332 family)
MNATDFYQLAVKLSNESGAAAMRSCISRAYYGAFNRASDVVRSIGVILPKSAECHDKVAKILSNCGDLDVETAGSKLDSLRTIRNAADYHLDDTRTEKKRTAILELHKADQIIQCMEQCFAGQPKESAHDAMKKYATEILQLRIKS